jgi:hypothetical protein
MPTASCISAAGARDIDDDDNVVDVMVWDVITDGSTDKPTGGCMEDTVDSSEVIDGSAAGDVYACLDGDVAGCCGNMLNCEEGDKTDCGLNAS